MDGYKIGGITALLGSGRKDAGDEVETTLSAMFRKATDNSESDQNRQLILQHEKPKRKRKSKDQLLLENDVPEIEGGRKGEESEEETEHFQAKKKKKTKEDVTRLKRTVFIGNVAVATNRKKLKKHFEKYGKVETVRTRSLPVANVKLPRRACAAKEELFYASICDAGSLSLFFSNILHSQISKRGLYHKDRGSMNSYIVFEDESAAAEALKSNGDVIDGLHIRVDLALASKDHDHSKSIFVGNLPFVTEEEELRKHFEECGTIADVRIIRDKKTGVGKGFGYVRFEARDGVTLALKMNQSTFKERALRVSRSIDTSKSKAKGRPIEGSKSFYKSKRFGTQNRMGQKKQFKRISNRDAFERRIAKKEKPKHEYRQKQLKLRKVK